MPALAGEPIPLPVAVAQAGAAAAVRRAGGGGAGDAATHIRDAIASGGIERGVAADRVARARSGGDPHRRRRTAAWRPICVWLVAELAVSPFAHALQRLLFGSRRAESLAAALDAWNHGYCPACGSWPALAEVVGGHRTLRCSFCARAWELTTYACIYCGESGEPFVTAAPDDERKDRRVEVCSACGGYLKTIDLAELSPFPLLAIADLETMDLDVAAMEHGYTRPPLQRLRVRDA